MLGESNRSASAADTSPRATSPGRRLPRALLLAAVLLTGCLNSATLGRLVEVRAEGFSVQPRLPGSLSELLNPQVGVQAEVSIENKAWLDVTMRDLHWRALLSDVEVASGVVPGPRVLAAGKTERLVLDARVSLQSLGIASVDALLAGQLRLSVDAETTVELFGFSHAVHKRVDSIALRLGAAPAVDPDAPGVIR